MRLGSLFLALWVWVDNDAAEKSSSQTALPFGVQYHLYSYILVVLLCIGWALAKQLSLPQSGYIIFACFV